MPPPHDSMSKINTNTSDSNDIRVLADRFSVIRLSQSQSNCVYSDGDWVNVLSNSETLYPGNTLRLQQGFIDSGRNTEDNIIVEEDTTLDLTYSYWGIDFPLGSSLQLPVLDASTGDPRPWKYQLSSVYSGIPMVDSSVFFCRAPEFKRNKNPKGDDPIFITVDLKAYYLDTSGIKQTIELKGQTINCRDTGRLPFGARNDNDFNLIPCFFNDQQGTTIELQERTLQVVPEKYRVFTPNNPNGVKYPLNKIHFVASYNQFPRNGDITHEQLVKNINTVFLPAGVYDRTELATRITRALSRGDNVHPGDYFSDIFDASGRQLLAYQNRMLTSTQAYPNYFYAPWGETGQNMFDTWVWDTQDGYFMSLGASEVALEYNTGGRPIYAGTFHTPLTDTSLGSTYYGQKCVAIYIDDISGSLPPNEVQRNYAVPAYSGIAFHALEPSGFFIEKLGFYDSAIIPTFFDICGSSSGVSLEKFHYNDAISKITKGFMGTGTLLQDLNPYLEVETGGFPASLYYIIDDNVDTLLGKPIDPNPTGGHYLIEITGMPATGIKDARGSHNNISIIASKQESSQDNITVYSDGGIPYVHLGEPIAITSARVRILDPVTNRVAAGLSSRNDLYFTIERDNNIVINNGNKKRATLTKNQSQR